MQPTNLHKISLADSIWFSDIDDTLIGTAAGIRNSLFSARQYSWRQNHWKLVSRREI